MKWSVALLLVACGTPPITDLDVPREAKKLGCPIEGSTVCHVLAEFAKAGPFAGCPTDDALHVWSSSENCVNGPPDQTVVWKVARHKPDARLVELAEMPAKDRLGCAQDLARGTAVGSVPASWSPMSKTTGPSTAAFVGGSRAFVRQAGDVVYMVWPSPKGGCYRELRPVTP